MRLPEDLGKKESLATQIRRGKRLAGKRQLLVLGQRECARATSRREEGRTKKKTKKKRGLEMETIFGKVTIPPLDFSPSEGVGRKQKDANSMSL